MVIGDKVMLIDCDEILRGSYYRVALIYGVDLVIIETPYGPYKTTQSNCLLMKGLGTNLKKPMRGYKHTRG